jgi:hypothetical protein
MCDCSSWVSYQYRHKNKNIAFTIVEEYVYFFLSYSIVKKKTMSFSVFISRVSC